MKRGHLVPAMLAAALAASTGHSFAQSVVMTVDRPTTLNFLRAATPYSFDAAAAGLTETFTLLNPRELVFEGGLMRIKVDCRGEPIPFAAVLEPTMSVTFDRQLNAFVAKVQSLPIRLGPLGTIQLDQYLDPFVLPVSFSQTLEAGIPGLTIDYLIRDVKVLEDRLEARADLVFRKNPPPKASARK
ncbi:MAG TPA: hypothetical protein VGK94_11350 [Candidatus Polarisedimenticolia bacterium]|jgi:hypothetical protein